MIPYFILFGGLSVLLILGGIYNKGRKYCFFCAVVILTLFSGLRKDVGVDYNSYLEYFNAIKQGYQVPMELGYQAIIKVIANIGGSFQFLVLLSALITNVLLAIFIYRYSPYPALSLFIYVTLSIFYLASFTAMRQFIAVAIFAYSIKYITGRQFIKYSAFIILGSTIHVTLILMFPFYFLLNRYFKLWHYIAIVIIYIISIRLIDAAIFWLGFSDFYLMKEESSQVNPLLLAFAVFGVGIVLMRYKLISFDPNMRIFVNMAFFSLLVVLAVLISSVQGVIVLRMSSYFSIAYLIIVPVLVNLIKDRSVKLWYLISIVTLFVSYYAFTIVVNGAKYTLTPYKMSFSIFEYK